MKYHKIKATPGNIGSYNANHFRTPSYYNEIRPQLSGRGATRGLSFELLCECTLSQDEYKPLLTEAANIVTKHFPWQENGVWYGN